MSLSPLSPNAIVPIPLVGVQIVIPVLLLSSINNASANAGADVTPLSFCLI
jgi:hypothetical protein